MKVHYEKWVDKEIYRNESEIRILKDLLESLESVLTSILKVVLFLFLHILLSYSTLYLLN